MYGAETFTSSTVCLFHDISQDPGAQPAFQHYIQPTLALFPPSFPARGRRLNTLCAVFWLPEKLSMHADWPRMMTSVRIKRSRVARQYHCSGRSRTWRTAGPNPSRPALEGDDRTLWQNQETLSWNLKWAVLSMWSHGTVREEHASFNVI